MFRLDIWADSNWHGDPWIMGALGATAEGLIDMANERIAWYSEQRTMRGLTFRWEIRHWS